MKKKKPEKLSDIIRPALTSILGKNTYRDIVVSEIETSVLPKTLGITVCRYISDVSYKNNVLTMKVSSASLKSNLSLQKSNLIDKINAEVGYDFVKNILIR